MKRKDFLKVCGGTGLTYFTLPMLLQHCGSAVHYVTATPMGDVLRVQHTDFIDGETFRDSIIVRFDQSAFPIVLFRKSENEYTALLLQCSHQGTELNVNGDLLTCNAHGSEFTNTGAVLTGPASEPLISFPVTTDRHNIYIHVEI